MVLWRSPEYQVVTVYNGYKYQIIVQGQMIKALLLLVSEKKYLLVFFLCSYVSNLWPPGRGQFWSKVEVEVHQEMLHTTYKALHLLVSEKKNSKVFLLCSKLVTPRAGPLLTPGALYEQSW